MFAYGGKALDELGGRDPAEFNQTMNAISQSPGVRLWGLSSVVERETAQTIS
jgi:hypothetical protein